ncbi:MAG: hypothetical protein BMS9Abin05_2703 [Rhodothermia bacterium]|nr:MAG: hypothetical protein BMS9Abin05_2703 [Rhodothermia bacterium]
MLLPIGDDNRELTGPAYVTTALIVIILAFFFLLQGAGSNTDFTYGWSVVPYEITTGVDLRNPVITEISGRSVQIPQAPGPPIIYFTIITAMFMHGGFGHLFGNLLFLWIFGDNVENRFGWRVFLGFYLASGIAATLTQIMLNPDSMIPSLGASGAISGVLGAYMVLFPRNKVYALFFFWVITVPAVVAIGLWIVFQVLSGWGALTAAGETGGGVAYGAHVGGFVAGVVMAMILRFVIKEEPKSRYSAVSSKDGSKRYW